MSYAESQTLPNKRVSGSIMTGVPLPGTFFTPVR
jgi:hypothetical protein